MPFTYTGRNVKHGSPVAPSLVDIAVGLSRLPRFAGQGRQWFSVLDHSLFADELARRTASLLLVPDAELSTNRLRLAVLLHDAHESMTGDVPTPFKGDELRAEQAWLDRNIGAALFTPVGDPPKDFHHPDVRNFVKWIDKRALAAEARVIGPNVDAEKILHAFGVTEDTVEDVNLLHSLLLRKPFGEPPQRYDQEDHPGVTEYLRRVLELM